MWWKIYFWLIAAITTIGVIALFFGFEGITISSLSIGDWISVVFEISLLVGTYTYTFKKKIWSAQAWKAIFWIYIVLLVLSLIDIFIAGGKIEEALPFLKSSISRSTDDVLWGMIYVLPALYAIYKLGHDNKTVKKSSKK